MDKPTNLPMQVRAMTLALDQEALATRAEGDERIPISLSSEQPVDRWFGREVLDHTTSAVDLSYARGGLPFLMDHDTRNQIGILDDVRLGKDGKLHAYARAGNHPDAAWVFADIRDGIRPNISVGYRVLEMKLEGSDERGDTYRVTRWMPMEGSTVPVPADITVGVGRATSDQQSYPVTITNSPTAGQEAHMEQNNAPAAGAAPSVGVARDYDAERKQRNAEMVAIADIAGRRDLLADAIAQDMTPAAFMRKIQDEKIAAAERAPSTAVKLTEKESGEYSLLRALGAQVAMMQGNSRAWERASFEREVSNEIASKLGVDAGRFFMPLNMKTRASVTGQTAGTTSLGGAGVQTSVMDLIEILRNNMVVRQAGARVLTGLSGNITFPRQITSNTLSWTGENPSTGNTNTSVTFDNVLMSPKTAMVSTAASRQSILQFNQDLEALVRDDLAQVIARGLDLAALDGTGSSNQPTGVLRQTGLNTVTTTFGPNGAVPDWAAIVQFETALATANAPTGAGWKWITTPGIRGKLKQTLQNTVAGANWIWESGDTINSYQALVSNQMPSNNTAGTSTTICHGMVLGNWSECLIGEFGGGVEIIVDPYTVASQNMIQYHAVVMADVAIRHGASFAFTKAAKVA